MTKAELEKIKAQTVEKVGEAIQEWLDEEPSPPPLGVNVVETITSKEKLGGD
jgi:hypothetical protein